MYSSNKVFIQFTLLAVEWRQPRFCEIITKFFLDETTKVCDLDCDKFIDTLIKSLKK